MFDAGRISAWIFFTVLQRTVNAEKTRLSSLKVGCLFTFLEGEWQILSLAGREKIQLMSWKKYEEAWNLPYYQIFRFEMATG